MNEPKNGIVQAGTRMIEILNFIAASPREVGIHDISRGLRLAPSTCHRLLATLMSGGFVEQNPRQKYVLGTRLIELGWTAQERLDVRRESLSIMRELADATQTTVNLARLVESEILLLEKVADRARFVLNIRVGHRRLAFCRALGKVLLAELPDHEVRRTIAPTLKPFTPNTITDIDEYLRHLAKVRAQGYAADREEAEVGCICVAAPIRDSDGAAVAALSMSGPTDEMNRYSEPEIAVRILGAAKEVSRRLGFRPTASA